ncbi:MAG: hypothetical protein V7K68_31710, partial [Nostoc sp.]|uniref:hypothetical protein n=1 Tax=Nostoc sp. TaxID=1180 RepID=UPI002FFB3FEB
TKCVSVAHRRYRLVFEVFCKAIALFLRFFVRRLHLLIVFTLKQQTDEYKHRLTLNYLLSRGAQLALPPYCKIHAA